LLFKGLIPKHKTS